MIKLAKHHQFISPKLLGCRICPIECELIDGAVCRSGVRRRLGDRIVQLNYGMIVNLKVSSIPSDIEGNKDERGLYVTMLGGINRSLYDTEKWATHYYQDRSADIGKFEVLESIESSGEYFSPIELINFSKSIGVGKIFFYNGEPATNIDYVIEVANVGRVEEVDVYLRSWCTIHEHYWDELFRNIKGISLRIDSLDIKYNLRTHRITSDFLRALLLAVAENDLLESVYTTIIPDVNDRASTVGGIRDLVVSVGQASTWVVELLDQELFKSGNDRITKERVEELITVARGGNVVNLIVDTGRMDI